MRRLILGYLALSAAVIGVWATAAPVSFYPDFGWSQPWVAVDGPFNEHLIRDVGSLNAALAVVTAAAAWRDDVLLGRIVAGAWIVTGAPHLAYHAGNLAPLGAADAASQIVALATQLVLPLLLLAMSMRRSAVEA